MLAAVPESVIEAVDALDLSEILTNVGEAIAYVDSNWVARFCNDVYLSNVGLTRAEVIGRTPFEYAPSFKRSIFYEVCESARVACEPKTRIGFSKVLNRWLMVRVFPLRGGLVLLTNNASESAVKQYHLAQKVLKDPLTDLGNKLAMEQKVDQLLKAGREFSVIVVGLDRFKEDVNDAHGYATGDMVLLEVASSLQTATVSCETLFRVGGDEFAVVHEGDVRDAAQRGMDLKEALRAPITLSGARIVLRSCCGTVECPKDGDNYETLLRRAGLAVREASRADKQQVTAYRPELEAASQMRSVMEAELRTAIEAGQFTLMIQPKVSLSTGAVVGGEALIRWAHPKRGMLAPGVFLGIAQDIKAMVSIDQWVLRQSLRISASLAAKGMAIPISINMSVDSLSDMYLADRVQDALDEAGVDPAMLEIEIPEGALMHDVAISSKVLAQLHSMGVRISIDDFGTGYSSFAYLAKFPVDTLKIDRSFVKDIGTDDTGKTIVRAIVQLAHSLSLDVIAEGAEEPDQLEILQAMKCDSVQGYAIAKPMPLNEFKQFIVNNPGRARPDPLAI